MVLKTKNMEKILQPIEAQVNKFQQVLATGKARSQDIVALKTILFEQLQVLINKFDNAIKDDDTDYREMKAEVTKIVEDFCSSNFNNNVEQVDKHHGEETINTLMENFIASLKKLEMIEYLPLKQNLEDCLEYVKEMGSVKAIEDYQNIKELGSWILDIFGPLQCYRKNLASKLLSEKIALYSRQLYTTFSMLVQLIQEQYQLNAPIYNYKKYVCDRMCCCFRMIIETLDAPKPSEEEENFEQENHFVYKMDLILDIISEMPGLPQSEQIQECEDLWSRIEDVFSHAMSIAQFCQQYNFNAITGVCQTIMFEYEKLKTQLLADPPDSTMNNLFMCTLNDALYRLERNINVSMLTLVMEVFSDPFGPLKKLVKSCGNALNACDRSKSDLAGRIEDFDQLTEKAMQIGFFAIACCRNVDRVNKIRSCLASLESLETELVAAITTFYLHPEKEMRANVKLLTTQWQQEINTFHQTVDLIIDSAAYCQVILDDMQERITVMSNCLDNREGVTESHVQGIVQRALSLSSQVSATVDDIGRENIDRHTLMMIRELKAAIYEANFAAKKLLHKNAPEPQQLRVIKRCEFILNVVKKLQPVLAIIMNNSISMSTTYGKTVLGRGVSLRSNCTLNFPSNINGLPCDNKTSYVRTPYTVKSCKSALSIEPANGVSKTQQADVSCLIPYIKRGRTMRTERSIMYKTPKKSEGVNDLVHHEMKMRNLSTVRQHLFSRDSFLQNTDIDLSAESIDLTSILETVTSLSETVNATPNTSIVKIENKNDDQKKVVDTSDTPGNYSLIGAGDALVIVETPQKIEGRRTGNKFEHVKKRLTVD